MAYVDLKAAFDSVDCNVLWLLLASSGLPREIINLLKALYTDTLSCVRVGGYDKFFMYRICSPAADNT